MDHLLDELLRLRAKGEFDAFGSSKEVGDDRKRAALDPVEQKSRSVPLDDAAMDFSDLQPRIDFCIDCKKVALLAQNLKKLSEVLNRHVRRSDLKVTLTRGQR